MLAEASRGPAAPEGQLTGANRYPGLMQENLVIRKPSVTDTERIAQAHSTASTAAPSLGHTTGSPGWGWPGWTDARAQRALADHTSRINPEVAR